MAARALFAGFLYLTTASSIHHHPLSPSPWSAAPSAMGPTNPLQVELSAGPANSSVLCTIRNNDPKHAISFLTWDTPFDPTAINTGILTIKDASTGAEIPSPGMKINRQMPPPRDALQEITPESTVSRELNLSSPWIPQDGKKYKLRVQGKWRAVWEKPAAQISDEELAAAKGDEATPGDYHSEDVEMTLGE
ncbi:hypothetical protein Q7P37_001113 [Cladosporium fusiforme]